MSALTYLPWPEPELPSYRAVRIGKWSLARTPRVENTAGYFLPWSVQPAGWVIKYAGKNVRMSLTRMEIESHMPHLAAARGHVVIAGLGMGFALYNIAKKSEVTEVTVLERDPEIVVLLETATKWHDWPGAEKVQLIIGDALEYRPTSPVDFLYADIWPKLGDEAALGDTQQMQANICAARVGYWGQEWDYFISLQKAGYSLLYQSNILTYRRFTRETGLPLIEQDNLRYPSLAAASVVLQIAAAEHEKVARAKLFAVYDKLINVIPRNPLDTVV